MLILILLRYQCVPLRLEVAFQDRIVEAGLVYKSVGNVLTGSSLTSRKVCAKVLSRRVLEPAMEPSHNRQLKQDITV